MKSIVFSLLLLINSAWAMENSSFTISLQDVGTRKEIIINMDDILTYSLSKHSIILTEAGFKKFNKMHTNSQFVACVNGKAIYEGKVWSSILSVSNSDLVLCADFEHKNTIVVRAGYPTEACFTGKDLRASENIMNALRKANKLKP